MEIKALVFIYQNHSRYSIWAGTPLHVIVCYVIADDNFVKRYKSELKSKPWNSEFIVTNPDIIYPKYLFNFRLNILDQNKNWADFGYAKNELNCHNPDCKKKWRCDCPQFPLVLKEDTTTID